MRGFPARILAAGEVVHRIHRKENGAWYFSSGARTRFDLDGYRGLGTCYVAPDPSGCFLEVFRDFIRIPEVEIRQRRLSSLVLPNELRLADCTARFSRKFGITGEIHASTDYALTQAWARAFVDAGFDGICHWLRHDPGKQVGFALFHTAGSPGWKAPRPQLLRKELLATIDKEYGIRVLPTPRRANRRRSVKPQSPP